MDETLQENLKKPSLSLMNRRQAVFGASVLVAGLAIVCLCLVPVFLTQEKADSLFFTHQQETFFFDLFGLISASWLFCWVASINTWNQCSKLGQWLGLLFLCIDQVNLMVVWKSMFESGHIGQGLWIAPLLLETYILGSFFGFFTLPGLTRDGNKTLTGLGTLLLILPWLIGRNQIILGTQFLNAMF